jgi:FixJ family two-component response regulator
MNASANKYVAVVDDDESVCRSFSRLLRMAGYQPVHFHSAEDFLTDRNRPHFECLVLDVQLGGISGIELWHRLAAVGDTTPVVFITAHDDSASRLEAEACGCAGYFRKTDPGDAILGTIRKAVDSNSSSTTNSQPS